MPLGGFRLNSIAKRAATAAPRNTFTVFGNAKISTDRAKFGSSSALFDGTTDYVTVNENITWSLPGQFTIECWVYPIVVTSNRNIVNNRVGSAFSTGNWTLTSFEGQLRFNVSGFANQLTGQLNTNQWNHVAAWRTSDNVCRLATNGVIQSNITSSLTLFASGQQQMFIGALDGGSGSWNGNIDELRISKIARYGSSNFTSPTAAFTNDANTLLLMHMEGTNGSTTFVDDNT